MGRGSGGGCANSASWAAEASARRIDFAPMESDMMLGSVMLSIRSCDPTGWGHSTLNNLPLVPVQLLTIRQTLFHGAIGW
jgi:hypothetical protein